MIFCIDIGNSNIKYAIFDGDEMKASFRVTSQRNATSDEYGVIVRDLLKSADIPREKIDGVIMSSVIPSLNYTMEHMCRDYLGLTPLIVGPGVKTGLNVKADNPREVGADIIVDSVSAIHRYGKGAPIICIDFGTATTFDIINEKGELIGVVISPGIKGSLDSLVNNTASLPNIELETPPSILAKNTVNCMQAGVVYGFLQYIQKPEMTHWIQMLVDYPIAFGVIGLGGLVKGERNLVFSVLIGGTLRFLCHLFTGAVFFGEYAAAGQSAFMYSLLYNAPYMFADIAVCVIIAMLPPFRKAIRSALKY